MTYFISLQLLRNVFQVLRVSYSYSGLLAHGFAPSVAEPYAEHFAKPAAFALVSAPQERGVRDTKCFKTAAKE